MHLFAHKVGILVQYLKMKVPMLVESVGVLKEFSSFSNLVLSTSGFCCQAPVLVKS